MVKLKAEKENDTVFTPFVDIFTAIVKMPKILWQLALVYLFQWYALFCYWQFITPMIKQTLYNVSETDEQRANHFVELSKNGLSVSQSDLSWAKNILNLVETAVGQTGLMNGFYNFVTMISALLLIPFALKYSSKYVYVFCLFATGISLLILPYIHNEYLILLPMVLFGIGWAAMMGLPYSMVSPSIPAEKRGVYMGVINMMIVIPMLIQTLTFGTVYQYVLGSNPSYAISVAGVLFLLASYFVTRIKVSKYNVL